MIMLRNRSRAVTSKQALMADHSSQTPSHTQTHNRGSKPPSFFVSSTFKAFTTHQNDALLSPTSILDSKPFFSLTNPFFRAKTKPPPGNKHQSWDDTSEGRGIGLVLNLKHDEPFEERRQRNDNDDDHRRANKVVLGTKLRVQIPPTDFGTKTRNICSHVPSSVRAPRSAVSVDQDSESYTCVISHGPVPRTTHIFENRVVDHNPKKIISFDSRPRSFLSFCHTCEKNLEQNVDVYIYRGEKAFCSRECRHKEMVLDGMGNEEFDDHSISR